MVIGSYRCSVVVFIRSVTTLTSSVLTSVLKSLAHFVSGCSCIHSMCKSNLQSIQRAFHIEPSDSLYAFVYIGVHKCLLCYHYVEIFAELSFKKHVHVDDKCKGLIFYKVVGEKSTV